MDRLPLFIDLRGRSVLLIGDGPAADAKRRLIEGAGGRVVREPEAETRLAFVALNGEAAEAEATRLKACGLLVNAVDRPELCDFLVPAIVDRSPVIVAIGTGGASASLAKSLRERLEALLPATLGRLADAIFASRAKVAAAVPTIKGRRRFWDALMSPGAPLDPLQAAGDPDAAIAAALESPPAARNSLTTIKLASSDPDDLTLRQLRALSQADTIFHTADVPAAILDRARRDAARISCYSLPPHLPTGASVFVWNAHPMPSS
jgi:uroporphyrin-III C-methyltransferase / precorrin-2 dehydrogenase / sirohydrochlorin ferrochelatase